MRSDHTTPAIPSPATSPSEALPCEAPPCEASPCEAPPCEEVWELEELPLDDFVAMARMNRERHPKMDAAVREGEDGSWEVVGFIDAERESPCFALNLQLEPRACVPGWASPSGMFSDPECSSQVAPAEISRCLPGPRVSILRAKPIPDSCPSAATSELWEIADARETELYARGVRGGTFFEAASGETCEPLAFPDGSWRCVPNSYVSITEAGFLHESPACDGDQLFAATLDDGCPANTPEPRGVLIIERSFVGCGGSTIVKVLESDGRVVPAGALYRKVDTGCIAATAPADALFVVGKPLNPAEVFTEIERTLGD